MKITHLIYSFLTGGTETMLVDIANEQAKYAKVGIVIINSIFNQSLLLKIDNRVDVIFINRGQGSRNPLPIIKLNKFLLKLKSDVLHCHNHNIIPLLLPSLRIISVLTVHDVNIDNKYFRYYKKLFAISEIVKEDIKKRSGISPILVYNGICTQKMLQKSKFSEDGIFSVVIVSRLHHEKKGQDIAIEALHLLKERGNKNIRLDLIGNGNSEHYLKELTIKYGLIDHVIFLGVKDRDYIYSHLKDYDLLIQPSFYEGFGLTVTEAMAAKVPVLVSNIDGPMEIIENGKYGFHFEAGHAEKLAEQLQYLITNYTSEELSRKVNAAYVHVKENFEISTTALKYIQNY